MDMKNKDLNTISVILSTVKSFFSFKLFMFPAIYLSALVFIYPSTSTAEQSLDHIAAIVNNDIVMMSNVLQQTKRLKATSLESADNKLVKKALEQLVLIKIQVQRGKELGIIIDDVMLNRTIEGIAMQNKLSLASFQKALQREGFEYSTFREEIRNRLMIDALKQRQSSRHSNISEQEVTDLILSQASTLNKDAQYHLQDILIPAVNGIPLAEFNSAREKAQQLRRQLLKQTKFANDDLTTNDLGWKDSNELPLAYKRVLNLMGVDEISPVIHDSKGFHILKLVEKRGGGKNLQQQVHARHILISHRDSKGQQKANKLRQQLLAGEDFATLATTNSADPSSAANGGDLGWATPTTYVPAFASIVKTLAVKAISPIVTTKFGWHIIQVLERKTMDKSREALRASAKSILSKKKNKNGYETWLQGVRDDAFVEYRLKTK
jgi:peptidyl-prolyl cis-trans isomerase SurA